MQSPNSFHIACRSRGSLSARITKAPLRLITDAAELYARNLQAEGAILPELDRSEPLTWRELRSLATDLDAPDALRLVKVPQRTNAFMRALGRSGLLFEGERGSVTNGGDTTLAEARPGEVVTTIDPSTGRHVALHIDAIDHPGQDIDQMLMGIACSEGDRGLVFCPAITVDVIDSELRRAQTPEDRLARREQVRQAAAELQGKAICYTLWVKGSPTDAETYEAYANLRPRRVFHDGTAYRATVPAAVQLLETGMVTSASFESVI
jgi:hypothetical protein